MGRVAAACRFGLGMCPGWMEQGEPSAEAQQRWEGTCPRQHVVRRG